MVAPAFPLAGPAGLNARLPVLALVPLLLLRSIDCRLLLAPPLRATLDAVGASRRLLAPERGEVTGDLTAAPALLAVPAAPAAPAVARGEVTGDLTEPPVLALALLLRPYPLLRTLASRLEALPAGLSARLLAAPVRAGPAAAVLAAAARPVELPVRVTVLELRLAGAGGLRVRAEGALAAPAVPALLREDDSARGAASLAAAAGSCCFGAAAAASEGAAALAAAEAPAGAAAAGLAGAGAAAAAAAGLAAGGELVGLLNFSAAPAGRWEQETQGRLMQAA